MLQKHVHGVTCLLNLFLSFLLKVKKNGNNHVLHFFFGLNECM